MIERTPAADRTMTFRWAKPADWDFRAGQFIDITLHDPPETDAEGDTRGFSISAAPCEGVIAITTRLRDTAFKRSLQQVPLGTTMKLEGPFGDFRLHHAARPAVLLAGGIGITPFRSMLVELIRCGTLPYDVVLFHANRQPQDAAFGDELRAMADQEPKFRFMPIVTRPELAPTWTGETGHIDGPMLDRHLARLGGGGGEATPDGNVTGPGPIYYVAGPAAMVAASRAMLVAHGIDEDDIRGEEFTGYGS